MGGENYYLITALPVWGELGSAPPMTRAAFLEHLAPSPAAREQAEAIFLADDLLQREAVLSGQLDEPDPAVLSDGQVRGEAPLPDTLATATPEGSGDRVLTDAIWEAYFRHAARVADRRGSRFLRAWVGFEVGLRNALVEARAKALQLDAALYAVATDLAGEDEYDEIVSQWSAAGDPLAGLLALDAARWKWLDAHDGRFSFADDELAAYAARLTLLHRWHRLEAEQERIRQGGADEEIASPAGRNGNEAEQ